MATLVSKCVGKWGAAAQGVAVVSRRFWRRGAVGQAGVLEVGCVCVILEAGCNQSVWGPSDRAQSVGVGVLVAGSSQSMCEPQRQGVIGRAEGSWSRGSVSPARVLWGLAVVSKWWQLRVIKPAGIVTVNFQATAGNWCSTGDRRSVC